MIGRQPRETAMQYVNNAYKMGTELRHRNTGQVFTLGAKADKSSFWMMGKNPATGNVEKARVEASRIRDVFERLKA